MPQVRVERFAGVARVVLDRPDQRNAVSHDMLEELAAAFDALDAEPQVRAVILAGEGADFCAGADLSDVTIIRADRDYASGFEASLRTLSTHPNPVIAEVQGSALGAGCQIVVACDLAVAAEDARIGIPSGKLGILPNFESIERLVLSVGPKRAGEILYAGRVVSGAGAAAWGLANVAVPAAELTERTFALAERIAGLAPLSVRGAKRGVRTAIEHLSVDRFGESDRVSEFDAMAAEAFGSEDLREGIRAFRERRSPKFRGK